MQVTQGGVLQPRTHTHSVDHGLEVPGQHEEGGLLFTVMLCL